MQYKIYAGLDGKEDYQGTVECDSEEEAEGLAFIRSSQLSGGITALSISEAEKRLTYSVEEVEDD